MPIRSTLITTAAVVLAAWPLATSAQGQPDEPSGGASPLQIATPHAGDLLVVEVPPLPPPLLDVPPSAASERAPPATRVAAPAAEPPAIANSPPPAAAGAAEAAARPLNSGQARRRTAARSAKTRAVGQALILLNARKSPVVSVTVTAGDTTVRQTRLVVPNARATIALPATSGCTVAVEALFEDDAASEVLSIDACRVKLVRLTD